jgi:hypothetical protein
MRSGPASGAIWMPSAQIEVSLRPGARRRDHRHGFVAGGQIPAAIGLASPAPLRSAVSHFVENVDLEGSPGAAGQKIGLVLAQPVASRRTAPPDRRDSG